MGGTRSSVALSRIVRGGQEFPVARLEKALRLVEKALPENFRGKVVREVVFENFDRDPDLKNAFAYTDATTILVRSSGAQEMLNRLHEAGLMPVASLEYGIAHEAGHALFNRLDDFRGPRSIYRAFRQEVDAPGSRRLTGNAFKNEREAFADAFATIATGFGERDHPFVEFVRNDVLKSSSVRDMKPLGFW